jgi:hypothetical protein
MRKLHRALVYLLITAIIEGTSFTVMYSSGFPGNPTASATGAVAFLIFFNLAIYVLLTPGFWTPGFWTPGFYIIPFFQLVAPVAGMFLIVTVIGEVTVWLRHAPEELEKFLKSYPKLEPKYD